MIAWLLATLVLLTQRMNRTKSKDILLYLPHGNHNRIPPRPLHIHFHTLWAQTAERDWRMQREAFEFITENPHTNLAICKAMLPLSDDSSMIYYYFIFLFIYVYVCSDVKVCTQAHG